jgi:hypothetical protein
MSFTPLTDVFGEKPTVPPWKNISLAQQQLASLQGNIAAMPDITKLGDLYQSYLTDQMNTLLPGYSDLLKSGAASAQQELDLSKSLLSGQIPQDVQDLVQRNSAYGAMQGGFAGSQMSGNLTARNLGLTSLDLMGQGANMAAQGGNAAQRWAGLASNQVMNPGAFYTNPQQMFQDTMQNQTMKWNRDMMAANVAAAPDPAAKGISDTIINLIGAYLGKGGGGGGTAANSYAPATASGSMNYNFGGDQQDPYNYANYGSLGLGAGGA